MYEPGTIILVGLVLVGRAIDYLPYFIYTFEQLGAAGLGPGRGRFRVDAVACAPVAGPSTMIYNGARRMLASPSSAFGVDEIVPRFESASTSITATFLTPVRLVHKGQTASPAEFHVLFRNALRRVNFLNHDERGLKLHGERRLRDFGSLHGAR